MKKNIFMLLAALIAVNTHAQQENFPKKENHKTSTRGKYTRRPILYINPSTGINNNTGLFGASIEVPLPANFSIEGGAGISTWGSKVAILGKYYLQDNLKGWAFGAGVTHNTGLTNYQNNMETIYGNETVELDLHPQTNVFAAAYKYWRLGRHANRIYLELGYSVPLTAGSKFTQTYGDPLSNNSTHVMNFLSPGGFIVGFGFSFGIH